LGGTFPAKPRAHRAAGRVCALGIGSFKIESERATPQVVIARDGGRSSILETPMMEPRSRGVLDTPHAGYDDPCWSFLLAYVQNP
jgi:hypothetical protein